MDEHFSPPRTRGFSSAFSPPQARGRAWSHHPFGANGLLAKAGEHVPLLADGLVCLHKYRGQTEAEERARAFSLQKHLSKTGALTKLAELLPGSNLLAAAMLHARGHHREAQEALNLLKNWRQCGGADGALAKVAELLPGVDVIAFGVHVGAGNFAQALRSISKTRWTDVSGDVTIAFELQRDLEDFQVADIQVSNAVVMPVASFMYGGLLDIAMNFIEVNASGQKRSRFHPASPSRHAVTRFKESLIGGCNEELSAFFQELPELLPELLDDVIEALNEYFRAERGLYGWLLPKKLPRSTEEMQQEAAWSLQRLKISHRRAIGAQVIEEKPLSPCGCGEAVASMACCAGLGLHSPGLACLAGCAVAWLQLSRWLQRQVAPCLNRRNAEAWAEATKAPAEVFVRPAARPAETTPMAFAVAAELDGDRAERLAECLGEHFLREVPLLRRLGRSRLLRQWALGLLASSIELPLVPLVLHFEVSEGLYPFLGQTLWLPSLSLALLLDCHVAEDLRLRGARLVVTDEQLDLLFDVLQTGLKGIDLRKLDERLAGFAEPVNMHCEAILSWPQARSPRLDLRNIKLHLALPG